MQNSLLLAGQKWLIERRIAKTLRNESEDFKTGARFLLWSSFLGPDKHQVGEASGVTEPMLTEFAEAAERNGIWRNGKVHANWFFSDHGARDLRLDVMALHGLLKRAQPAAF
jgi:hypothetical protein